MLEPRDVSDSPPDPTTRAGRAALAKMVTRLFDLWELPVADQARLLGLKSENRSTLARYRRGDPLADSQDLIERVGNLLGIHKALRTIFPYDRESAYRWVMAPNRRFGGKTAVQVMEEQGFIGVAMVRRYLDFECGR